jgi:putative ABC transport system ATP-binding protein
VTVVAARGLVKTYGRGRAAHRVLDGADLTARAGELVAVVGRSGSGKSTLLHLLGALDRPDAGAIEIAGERIDGRPERELTLVRRRRVGFVFQFFHLVPELTGEENVLLPTRIPGSDGHAAVRGRALVARLGLDPVAGRLPHELSGGEQQRLAVARALVHDPPLVIADEPTAHLDYVQIESTLRLIRTLAAPGRLVLVATHDERITNIADRVIDLAPHAAEPDDDSQEVTLDAGEVLFEQGDPGCIVYLLEEGSIEIYRARPGGGEEEVAILEPGQYFGELGPMLNLPRSASARALTPTRLTGMTVSAFKARVPEPAVSACFDPMAKT